MCGWMVVEVGRGDPANSAVALQLGDRKRRPTKTHDEIDFWALFGRDCELFVVAVRANIGRINQAGPESLA